MGVTQVIYRYSGYFKYINYLKRDKGMQWKKGYFAIIFLPALWNTDVNSSTLGAQLPSGVLCRLSMVPAGQWGAAGDEQVTSGSQGTAWTSDSNHLWKRPASLGVGGWSSNKGIPLFPRSSDLKLKWVAASDCSPLCVYALGQEHRGCASSRWKVLLS